MCGVQIFMEDDPSLGLHFNLANCELLSPQSFNILTMQGGGGGGGGGS